MLACHQRFVMDRFGSAAARAAHDQLGLKNLPRLRLFAAKAGEQSIDGERSDPIHRLANGRQRNARSSRQLDVVDTDHSYVFWDANAVVEERVLEPQRAQVIVDEDSVGLDGEPRHSLANRVAGTEVIPFTLVRVLEL